MEGWTAHCALQMVQGLRRGRSGQGPEMDGLIMIASLDTDPCSWVPSSTLDPQWRAKFTANGEISCDLSFSHVSFCLKKPQNLLLLMSHGLILTSAYWLKSGVELQTWAPLLQLLSNSKYTNITPLKCSRLGGLTINFSPDSSGAASTNY